MRRESGKSAARGKLIHQFLRSSGFLCDPNRSQLWKSGGSDGRGPVRREGREQGQRKPRGEGQGDAKNFTTAPGQSFRMLVFKMRYLSRFTAQVVTAKEKELDR